MSNGRAAVVATSAKATMGAIARPSHFYVRPQDRIC
jgi:hypothetical protein